MGLSKNIIKPYEIKVGSGIKIWWKCKEGHSWEAAPNHRKRDKAVLIVPVRKYWQDLMILRH